MLQCAAVCCSVLQSVAASHNNTDLTNSIRVGDRGGLDAVGVSVWCSVLQSVAECCRGGLDAVGVSVWCRVLQCTAMHCSVLQCVAVSCSVLQGH